MRRPGGRDLRIPCRFEDLTVDLPLNQVIRYTLKVLSPPRSELLRRRLRRLGKLLAPVRPVPFRPDDIDHLDYDRLTAHYKPIHSVCRVLLEARGLDGGAGEYPLGCYLSNMTSVFGRFVAGWMQENLPAGFMLETQWRGKLDVRGMVGIRPDIILRDRRGRALVAADTKYKDLDGADGTTKAGISSSDAYQVLAYCRALGVRAGMLIYPSWRRAPLVTRVWDEANVIAVDGVDVSAPLAALEQRLRGLMASLVGLA